MTPIKSIKESWEQFTKLFSKNTSPLQVKEMKRSYYAGANAFYTVVMNILDPGNEATENDLQLMRNLHNELVQYGKNVLAGKE